MANKVLYIEATSGASGDMFLGALIDLGVPVEVLRDAWDALEIDNYEVEIFETHKSGMRALQCRVRTEEKQGPRNWREYQKQIKTSGVPDHIKNATLRLVKKLFEIEAGVHGKSIQKLSLHEAGGTDLMLDLIGTLAAIDFLKPTKMIASPVNTGRGFVRFSHGKYPVPAPATATLLHGVPIFQNEVEGELTTPTGALLITHLAESFGPMPSIGLQNIGVGAGEKEIPDHPNVLRIFSGVDELPKQDEEENILMLETNIDDANPQILAYFMEKAFQEGALDVFFTPVVMKKNRPGVRLSLLTPESLMQRLTALLFAETTAIGLRYWRVDRTKLERRWSNLNMAGMVVRVKESYLGGKLYNYQPEYEDCRLVAEKMNRPVKEIISEAIHLYLQKR